MAAFEDTVRHQSTFFSPELDEYLKNIMEYFDECQEYSIKNALMSLLVCFCVKFPQFFTLKLPFVKKMIEKIAILMIAHVEEPDDEWKYKHIRGIIIGDWGVYWNQWSKLV